MYPYPFQLLGFFPHHFRVSTVCFLKPCVNYRLNLKKKKEIEKREECCVDQLPAVLATTGNLCNWHLHYLFHYLKMRKRTMQFSILRAFIVIRLYSLHNAELLYCVIYHIFKANPGNGMFWPAAIYWCLFF